MCNNFAASYPGPIMINVRTDESLKGLYATGLPQTEADALAIVASGGENGFKLLYNLNTNCKRPQKLNEIQCIFLENIYQIT